MEFLKDKDKIIRWLVEYYIRDYTINDDLTVDVDGYVRINVRRLCYIPVKFGKVTGDFMCYRNYLETLHGCPDYVGGIFDCSSNKLKSLEGGPKYVGGDYYCDYNRNLASLDGIGEVGGEIFAPPIIDLNNGLDVSVKGYNIRKVG